MSGYQRALKARSDAGLYALVGLLSGALLSLSCGSPEETGAITPTGSLTVTGPGSSSGAPGDIGNGGGENLRPDPASGGQGVGGTSEPSTPGDGGASSLVGGSGGAPASGTGGASGGSTSPPTTGGQGGEAPINELPNPMTGPLPPFDVPGGDLQLEVCTPRIIRVMFAPDPTFFTRSTLATAPKECDAATEWSLQQDETTATVTTSALSAIVELATGAVRFADPGGTVILAERERSLEAVSVQGDETYNIRQVWEPNDDEALYGLGQHQQNLMNIKGYPLSLVQYNTQIVVPFFTSSRGYGVLWDNTSWTRWGDLTELTSINNGQANYQGTFTAETTGDYLFQTYSSGRIQLQVDGQTLIEHWRQGWLPDRDYARVPMQAGQSYAIQLSHEPDIGVEIAELSYKPPEPEPVTSLWSKVGEGIDYWFIYGPELDAVVAGYRGITGQAPMMPKWAHGMWQCRERYSSAAELLGILGEFRSRGIPIDNIVQDWQYWVPGTWGSHEFDTAFANPADWISQIHDDYNAHFMISVWPKFHSGTSNFSELNDAGHLYQRNLQEDIRDFNDYTMTYYDAFSSAARSMYWSQMAEDLFVHGVDAWWLDGTEPEMVEGPYSSPTQHRELYEGYMHPTDMGSGSRMLNAYSIVNSQAVYEGQRAAAPDQRVFILTRSAFAGQQRYAAASWSGDISTTWSAFKKQIPAGLSFSISGIPYWTMDIGGFAEDPEIAADRAEWEELNVRWFQYGTFTPILRVHGQDDLTGPREMYALGEQAYQAQLKFDRLRYRLMPYIYSLAGAASRSAGTLLRPLVMDFRNDTAVREIGDQYMFGPAFLVNPVTDYQARNRAVYLPQSQGGWYDFWTGAALAGGQSIDAEAPYDALPLFIRAGSILPAGPELEYVDQAPANPITLYVYAGADGSFTLYEDDGLSYAYETGAYSQIPLNWNEAARTLTIGARQGSFPGMLQTRNFEVVLVETDNAVGFSFEPAPVATVAYDGTEVSVQL